MNRWDQRYSEAGFAYGTEPNVFLAAEAHRIPLGRVLSLAEGEGRNAVYLARLGYTVHAVDLSAVGLDKAMRLAAEHGVRITTDVIDLDALEIEREAWEGIVSISAHVASATRARLHRKVVDGLKPGGVLILEAYTPRQLETGGIGGPKQDERDRFMTLDALRGELQGLALVVAREIEREVNEGRYHRGPGAVVEVVGVKPHRDASVEPRS